MSARSVSSTVPPVDFDGPVTLPIVAPIAGRLDAVLTVIPVVAAFGPDPAAEGIERLFGLGDTGLVIRRVRLVDGRCVTVAAVPSRVRSDVLAFKRAVEACGRRVILVPEGALDREPLGTNSLLIAGCAGARVSPSDRLALVTALLEAGGSLSLADAAEIMVRSDDPVAAVLALVPARVVLLDLAVPVGPDSTVRSTSTRAHHWESRR